jgi:hypothetical protein
MGPVTQYLTIKFYRTIEFIWVLIPSNKYSIDDIIVYYPRFHCGIKYKISWNRFVNSCARKEWGNCPNSESNDYC